MRKLCVLLSSAVFMLLATGQAGADSKSRPVYSIIGAWDVITTVRAYSETDCTKSAVNPIQPNPFPALYSFQLGGTVSETGSRRPPSQRSPGLGAWRRTGRDSFAARIKFQEFDGNGLLFRVMDAKSEFVLSQRGDVLTGVSTFTFTDVSGNVLKFCATSTGTRFTS